MAYYLVTAVPRHEQLGELSDRLRANEFVSMRPFGVSLTVSLKGARVQPDGTAIWEEEDYCSPPLAQERAAVLDDYFNRLQVEKVESGEGWKRIRDLPRLFPEFAEVPANDAWDVRRIEGKTELVTERQVDVSTATLT